MAASGALPACGFAVTGGKNGSLPIKVEKRPKGKKATIISNVTGSAKSLLSALSTLLGAGGTLHQQPSGHHWTIEVQGDQVDRVAAALAQLGCLKGIKKPAEERESRKDKEVTVARRDCGYDKFLRRQDAPGASSCAHTSLPGAECFKWHGDWLYCRGHCMQADLSDVWEDGSLNPEASGFDGGSTARPSGPEPCRSLPELNMLLRDLGMLAEVGAAARVGERNPARYSATSLADYRRAAIAPGARLITEEPSGGLSAKRRAASRGAPRSGADQGSRKAARARSCEPAGAPPRPAPPPARMVLAKPPPKQGVFRCSVCGSVFGLAKTLKLHMRNSHPGVPGGGANARGVYESLVHRAGRSTLEPPPAAWGPSSSGESGGSKERVARSGGFGTDGVSLQVARRKMSPPRRAVQRSDCPICLKTFLLDKLDEHVEICLAAAKATAVDSSSSSSSDGESAGAAAKRRAKGDPSAGGRGGSDVERGGAVAKRRAGAGVKAPATCAADDDDLAASCLCRVTAAHDDADGANQLAIRPGDLVRLEWRQPKAEGGYWAYCALEHEPKCIGYVPIACLARAPEPEAAPRLDAPAEEAPAPRRASDAARGRTDAAKAGGGGAGGSVGSNKRRGEDDGIPEEWLETFLLLQLPDAAANNFWVTFERYRKTKSLEDAWLSAMDGACSTLDAVASSPASQEQEGTLAPTPDQVEETARVSRTWTPDDDSASVQIRVKAGDQVVVEWRQPEQEGGYWAYGHVRGCGGRSQTSGYFPLECLAAKIGPRVGDRAAPANATTGAANQSQAAKASRRPAEQKATGATTRASTATAAASNGARVECPLCAALFPATEIEAHAARCCGAAPPGASDASAAVGGAERRSQHGAPPEDFGTDDAGLEEDARRWAETKLVGLAERFCVQELDASVALASLALCTDASDLRREAVALLGDNQPVKNFAAELWRRRQQPRRAAAAAEAEEEEAPQTSVSAAPVPSEKTGGRWRGGARRGAAAAAA